MKLEGLQPVIGGLSLATVLTSFAGLIGTLIKRDQALKAAKISADSAMQTHIIDDRGKVTQDTAAQLTQALIRADKTSEHIQLLNNDKTVLVNTLISINAHLILLSGLFDQEESNIATEVIDITALRRTNVLINETIDRMKVDIKNSEAVYYRNTIIPSAEKAIETSTK